MLGLVPICSAKGFNKEIVGDDFLIVNSFDPNDYAEKIRNIWQNSKWLYYSKKVNKQIVNNYTEDKISSILIPIYKNLINLQ